MFMHDKKHYFNVISSFQYFGMLGIRRFNLTKSA